MQRSPFACIILCGIAVALVGTQCAAHRSPTEASPSPSDYTGSVVVGKIAEKDAYAYGFDAQNAEFGNLVSKGIIDPTKVVRTALQDAASIAGLLITTEAMVAELPKKQSPAPAMPPGGGMDF